MPMLNKKRCKIYRPTSRIEYISNSCISIWWFVYRYRIELDSRLIAISMSIGDDSVVSVPTGHPLTAAKLLRTNSN